MGDTTKSTIVEYPTATDDEAFDSGYALEPTALLRLVAKRGDIHGEYTLEQAFIKRSGRRVTREWHPVPIVDYAEAYPQGEAT